MTAPLGWVGATLLLWGISIGVPWLGAIAGIAFEASRHLAPADPARAAAWIAPATRLAFLAGLGSLGYVVATRSLPNSLYLWLRWLPLMLLALPVLQMLAGRLPAAALMRALRPKMVLEEDGGDVETTHAYGALALAAAGTGNQAEGWLYYGYVVMLAWAILARAPRRGAAAALLAAAALVGSVTHMGLWTLQGMVDEWSQEFITAMSSGNSDPFRERTRIGDLGKIKLSERILMRVAVEGPRPAALLLRDAAFDQYRSGEWVSTRRMPRLVSREGDRWLLSPGAATKQLAVRKTIAGGEGLLPLPEGTRAIARLPAAKLEAFGSGAVRAHGTPRFVAYTVAYAPEAADDAPVAQDLEVPHALADTLASVAGSEGLARGTPRESLQAVGEFFNAKFAYSLDLGSGKAAQARTIVDFLVRDRKGHCEYFATATVLLLRQAGIPARYVAGYSAQEYSSREGAYLVRVRHGHAWASAYVDGRWTEVDTTPSRWAQFEAEAASGPFDALLDLLSWWMDRLVQAWIEQAGGDWKALGLGVLVLGAVVAMAVLALRTWRRKAPRRSPTDGLGRAWASVERCLAAAGHARRPDETVRAWTERLRATPGTDAWSGGLAELGREYYRVRFDPAASAPEVETFAGRARRWSLPRA